MANKMLLAAVAASFLLLAACGAKDQPLAQTQPPAAAETKAVKAKPAKSEEVAVVPAKTTSEVLKAISEFPEVKSFLAAGESNKLYLDEDQTGKYFVVYGSKEGEEEPAGVIYAFEKGTGKVFKEL